jgi:HK97 family phage major capsid protein
MSLKLMRNYRRTHDDDDDAEYDEYGHALPSIEEILAMKAANPALYAARPGPAQPDARPSLARVSGSPALPAAPAVVPPALVPTARNDGGFRSLGEQLLAIKAAGEAIDYPVGLQDRVDPRLRAIERRAAAAGNSEAVPSDGGFLVAPFFVQNILRRMYRTGEIFSRCMELPITDPSRNAVRFPMIDEQSRANGSRWGGVYTYWQNEADAAITTKPKFKACELKAEKLTGLLYLTDELANDSAALSKWASVAFSSEMLFNLENCIVNGSGLAKPQGLVGAPGTIVIAKQSGQAAATVVPLNIVQMASQLWSASRPNAIWLYNQQLLPQLMTLSLAVGTGGSEARLFHYCSDDSGYDYLAGIPAIPSEYCQVPGTPGDLILADFSRYVLAMRDDSPQAAVSIHVKFLTDEVAFRFTWRINGMPVDAVPITVLNGSLTVAPMLVLAARP